MTAKPKTDLYLKRLDRFALVDQGDNPGAHMVIAKNRDDDPNPEHEGEGPAMETPAQKGWFARLTDFVMKRDHYEPMTTSQIMDKREQQRDVWDITDAFIESIHTILKSDPEMSDTDMVVDSTVQFIELMREAMASAQKKFPQHTEQLLDICDSLEKTASAKAWNAETRNTFADAFEALVAFELPSTLETNTMTQETAKGFEQLLEGVEDQGVRNALKAAHADEMKKAEEKKKKEEMKAKEGHDEEEEGYAAMKSLPESVRKRLEAAEATAAKAQKKADLLEAAAKRSEYVSKAQKLEMDGVDVDTVAKALQAADEHADGEAIKSVLDAAAAMAKKAADILGASIGTVGTDSDSDAERQLEGAAKALMAEHPEMNYFTAYSTAMKQRPDLYEEANG